MKDTDLPQLFIKGIALKVEEVTEVARKSYEISRNLHQGNFQESIRLERQMADKLREMSVFK